MMLAGRISNSAKQHSQRDALILRGERYSYEQLDRAARNIAHQACRHFSQAPSRIGVYASRSWLSYASTLAAVYAGAAFVPLNPRFPVERTRKMIDSAGLDLVLGDDLGSRLWVQLRESGAALPPFWDADQLRSIVAEGSPLEEVPLRQPSDLVYLLFTSGSTGQPKGVPISEGNLEAYLSWARQRYQFEPEDRFSQTFDQTFDLSVHDIFLCWESGAALYPLSPPELLAPASFIQKHALTVWFSVPSVVAQMRKRGTLKPQAFPSLRWSLFCGEALPQAAAQAWLEAAPNSTLENLYGPTELTIACTVHRWDPEISPGLCRQGMVPIGRAFPGLTEKILEDRSELAMAGAQMFGGYWQDPERSAQAILELPEGRFYKTGDRVERLPNGELVCLGRLDHQIKLLGFRVELGEIEAVLRSYPAVVNAVAVGWPMENGSAQGIVAFVQGANLDTRLLQEHAQKHLSDYMVPARFLVLDEFPLNANGKVDRAALAGRLEA